MTNPGFSWFSTRSVRGSPTDFRTPNSPSSYRNVPQNVSAPPNSSIPTQTPSIEKKWFGNKIKTIESFVPVIQSKIPDMPLEKINELANELAQASFDNVVTQQKWERFVPVLPPLDENMDIKNLRIRISSSQKIEIYNKIANKPLVLTNYQEMWFENTKKHEESKLWFVFCVLAINNPQYRVFAEGTNKINREDISRLNELLKRFFGRDEKYLLLNNVDWYRPIFHLTIDESEIERIQKQFNEQ